MGTQITMYHRQMTINTICKAFHSKSGALAYMSLRLVESLDSRRLTGSTLAADNGVYEGSSLCPHRLSTATEWNPILPCDTAPLSRVYKEYRTAMSLAEISWRA